MNSMRAWAAAICSASIALAVLEGLLPEKSTARAARLAAALWLILAVISPLAGLKKNASDISVDFHAAFASADMQDIEEPLLSETARNLENELYLMLCAKGVASLDIEASVNISEETGIYCDSVVITLDEEDAASSALVRSTALEAVGREPEIKEMK